MSIDSFDLLFVLGLKFVKSELNEDILFYLQIRKVINFNNKAFLLSFNLGLF